jgi:endonuclease/exonuclease/phosphatase (EEP) superfamily protein YafD
MTATDPRPVRLLQCLVSLATALAVGGWLVMALRNDTDPVGMLLGFAPRWWAVLPWVVLLPLAFRAGRRTVLVAMVGLLVCLFGVGQFELPAPWRLLAGGWNRRGDIRVVTYNTDLSEPLAERLRADLIAWDADIILLQDCPTIVADSLRAVYPRAVALSGFCVASRWPVLGARAAASLAPADARLWRGPFAVRARVQTPFGVLPVYSVHLPSPRQALSAARWPRPRELQPLLDRSIAERGDASAAVSGVVPRQASRFVVAGDFNLPYGSAILGRDWGDLINAFARAGFGFGYTMQAGIFPVRIDHVLVSETLEPRQARVLSGYPSEHQPVVVDLEWRG